MWWTAMRRSRTCTASWVIAGREARSSTVDSRLPSNPGGRELGDIGPHLIQRHMDVHPHFPALLELLPRNGQSHLEGGAGLAGAHFNPARVEVDDVSGDCQTQAAAGGVRALHDPIKDVRL